MARKWPASGECVWRGSASAISALFQQPDTARDPACRRRQVAPEEEPKRPARTHSLRRAPFPRGVTTRGGPRSMPPRKPCLSRPCRPRLQDARDPRRPTAPRDEPPTIRRTRHPTPAARTSRELAPVGCGHPHHDMPCPDAPLVVVALARFGLRAGGRRLRRPRLSHACIVGSVSRSRTWDAR
jgi:hypothetical protein